MLHYLLQLYAAKIFTAIQHPQLNQTSPTTSKTFPIMSSDTEELIRKHFNALDEEEIEFTSGQSETQSQLLGQLEAEEARELEEALRLSAQEAMERQKKKGNNPHKTPRK